MKRRILKSIWNIQLFSSKSIKLKIKYKRTEIKLTENEKKAIQEKEEDVKKQINSWMDENFE